MGKVCFEQVCSSFERAAATYESAAVIQNAMGQQLMQFWHCPDTVPAASEQSRRLMTADTAAASAPAITANAASAPAAMATSCRHMLEIGCGPGNFTRMLLDCMVPEQSLCLNDLSGELLQQGLKRTESISECNSCQLQAWQGNVLEPPAVGKVWYVKSSGQESLPEQPDKRMWLQPGVRAESGNGFQDGFDVIVSNAVFQWFPDLELALGHLRQLAYGTKVSSDSDSRPRYLVYSSFLEGTFSELQQVLGMGLDYYSADEVQEILERYCTDIRFKTHKVVQHFESSFHLLRHFRDTGVNALNSSVNGSESRLGSGSLRRMMHEYEERFSDDNGMICLTWQPYFVVARWRQSL